MIDKNPAVGRILFEDSILLYFRPYGKCLGVITKISKSRIYYLDFLERECYVTKFGVICDTEEEVNELKKFQKDCIDEVISFLKESVVQFNQLVKNNNQKE